MQLGFISGTFLFALLAVSDRYSPRYVFLVCSVLGAACNAGLLLQPTSYAMVLASRFFSGFFLAGIYPVGMKIAAGWYKEDLGRAIGYLVGALVLGTAFPHWVTGLGPLPWDTVILTVSTLAVAGGIAMWLGVPDGPHLVPSGPLQPGHLREIFSSRPFRSAAFGYFGHMWELYAFWAFVPAALTAYSIMEYPISNIPGLSFWIIGAGVLGCVAGGMLSLEYGSARVAFLQLAASGICCLVSPLMFSSGPEVFLMFLVFWGMVVVGDSPQFSALNARFAPQHLVGTALTMVTCIGFALTIVSLYVVEWATSHLPPYMMFVFLAPGPVLGLIILKPLWSLKNS